MIVKLELTPEVQAGLLTQARRTGLSLEAYLEKVLVERAQENIIASPTNEPFWKSFTREVHALPNEVFERLPKDGAPKRNTGRPFSRTHSTGLR